MIRQPSGHGVTRIEPDWARAGWLGDVIVALKFAPDEHRTFTWRRDPAREPVRERVDVSFPRS